MIQLEIKNKWFGVCLAFLFCASLALPLLAEGAEIFFGAQNQKIGLDKLFEVGVFINTENEPVNAIAGNIKFSSEFLELKEAREGNSIINFWIEKPSIPQMATDKKTNGNEVAFSGITPGGYIGQKGYLFSLIFKTKKAGETTISASEEQIFLNDGQGSKANTKEAPLFLRIEKNVPDGEFSLPSDSEKPDPFEPTVAQDSKIFGGKYFLVFLTQDKKSGIDHYEVQESDNKQPEAGEWIVAESPYVLTDQKLRSYIYVKAVDKAGNERISELKPANPLTWYEKALIWCMIILAVVFCIIIGKFLWKKKIAKLTRSYTQN